MTTHTPGPWIAGWSGDPDDAADADHGGQMTIVAPNRGEVATCRPIATGHASTHPIVGANARLIAAAPDLLQACQEVAGACYSIQRINEGATCVFCDEPQGEPHEPDCTMNFVLAAIAKAEGGS